MSNSTVHLNLADVLTSEERELFLANARVAGRKPNQHLRTLIFGEAHEKRPTPKKKGAARK